MPAELELKLQVTPRRLPALGALLAALAAGTPVRRELVSHYFDVRIPGGDFALRTARAALRVRHAAGQRVQTLKAAGSQQAGLYRRGEWETPVEADAPDLARLAQAFPDDTDLAACLAALAELPPAQRIFTTALTREAYRIERRGAVVEAALDSGEIVAGKRRAPICELELELVAGDAATIFALAGEIAAACPVSLGLASKAERGYSLLKRARRPGPAKAKAVELAPAMPVEDAFVAIFAAGLSQLVANQEGFLHGRNPEYLHQMRVAIRRTRAALALFGRVVPRAAFADVAARLGYYGRFLGTVRNWDVFEEETLAGFATHGNPQQAQTLARMALPHLSEARRVARTAVRHRDYTRFVLDFASFSASRRWRGNVPESSLRALAEPVGEFAVRALRKRHRQLLALAPVITGEDAEARHAARIAGKKLRYCGDFFATLLREKERTPYLAALANLQDALGRGNDLATAFALLADLRNRTTRSEEVAAVEACRQWLESGTAGLREDIAAAWDAFVALPRPPLAKVRKRVTRQA